LANTAVSPVPIPPPSIVCSEAGVAGKHGRIGHRVSGLGITPGGGVVRSRLVLYDCILLHGYDGSCMIGACDRVQPTCVPHSRKCPLSNKTTVDAVPEERQRAILRQLNEVGRVSATEVAARFGVSEDSVRRDLRELAARGLCHRVYGGALARGPDFTSLSRRRDQQADRKLLLARKAATLVTRNQTVMIDAGSTNSAVAEALPDNQGLTVVTNAPDIAQRLVDRDGFQILLIGGRIDKRSGAAVGAQTIEAIRRIRADICFPGACAVDLETGLWSMDDEEAFIKRAMIESSAVTVVVVTADKLGAAATHHVAPIEQIEHLVVDYDIEDATLRAFEARGLILERADPK
jgi:DeoR/GlpR family transcriptional regulator of sugar metabolism